MLSVDGGSCFEFSETLGEVFLAPLLLVLFLVLVEIALLGQSPVAIEHVGVLALKRALVCMRPIMVIEITELPSDVLAGGSILPVALDELEVALRFLIPVRVDTEVTVVRQITF
jgi:hypothetical protein